MTTTTNIICPHCNTVNRIPATRLGDRPLCGKCKRPLFTGYPLELNDGNFTQQLARSDIPVVVDFWAAWCGPCKMMAPAFAAAAGKLEPTVRLAKLNTETEQTIGAQLGIRSIPTMIIFSKGREVARQSGAMAEHDIIRWVQSNT